MPPHKLPLSLSCWQANERFFLFNLHNCPCREWRDKSWRWWSCQQTSRRRSLSEAALVISRHRGEPHSQCPVSLCTPGKPNYVLRSSIRVIRLTLPICGERESAVVFLEITVYCLKRLARARALSIAIGKCVCALSSLSSPLALSLLRHLLSRQGTSTDSVSPSLALTRKGKAPDRSWNSVHGSLTAPGH